jgi:hypothetical protein
MGMGVEIFYDAELVAQACSRQNTNKHDLNNFLMVYMACTGQYGELTITNEENAEWCEALLRRWVVGEVPSLKKEVEKTLYSSQNENTRSHSEYAPKSLPCVA